jgi:DNA-binding CsgD family transcriptional regulator
MQLGVRGILANDISVDALFSALQTIRGGGLCFERELTDNLLCQTRVTLTRRERQLVSLVAQGLKNKEIAYSLGIAEGTVKVYLSRLFEKLGLKDRLDLALYGLRNLFSGYSGIAKRPETGRAAGDCELVGPHACLLPHAERTKAAPVESRHPRRLVV